MKIDRIRPFLPWWPLFILWVALVFYLSLTSTPPMIESDFFGWDKFQHAAAYGLLTFLIGMAFRSYPIFKKWRWQMAAGVAVIIGGLIEIAQGALTTYRTPDLGDLIAEIIGVGLIYVIMRRY